MQALDGKLENIKSRVADLLADCARHAGSGDDQDLSALTRAFGQLTDVMQRIESDADTARDTGSAEITEIGNYALQLAENLAAVAGRCAIDSSRERTAALMVELALWIAVHEGVIDTLEPVVDALALLANATRDPARLEKLGMQIATVVDAVSPLIREDLEKINPGRPWRVLLLNQSIVATRSHNTGLMERAFDELTARLPEDAARFFTEGMQQMDALDYPEPVRAVMARYHRQWTLDRSLH